MVKSDQTSGAKGLDTLHAAERRTAITQRGPDGAPLPPYRYNPKHRWEVKLNFMSGTTLLPWLKLLFRHGRSVHWLTYPHRVLFLSFMAVINTLLSFFDWLFFSRAVSSQPLHPEPLFILGHPRSGTTHIHNLLATDPRFAFATTFHAGFPSSFLTLEPARGLLTGLLERHRPMDNMALHWDLPAEDEIAINVLTGGDSPYLALVFPRLWRPLLRKYLDWSSNGSETKVAEGSCEPSGRQEVAAAATAAVASGGLGNDANHHADDPRVTSAAFQRWLAAFLWFMKKVTYRYIRNHNRNNRDSHSGSGSDGRGSGSGSTRSIGTPSPVVTTMPLLIKSPVHTARLGTWLRLFPRARFVYVHRHPLEVFQSAANMADTYYWFTYLQRPTDNVTNDFIMDQYDILYRSYMAERSRIPADRLVEIGFSDLDSDPLGVLRRIYHHFGWDEQYDALSDRFQSYVSSLGDFKKNQFNRIIPEVESVVRERWGDSFRGLGYT